MTTAAAGVGRRWADRIPPRVALGGVLGASGVAVLATRISFIAIPWYVLVTTHSPVKVGLVSTFELVPYVVVLALGGPLLDRIGVRRGAICFDAASAAAVAAVVAFHAAGLGWLVLLVAFMGGLRGFGDNAKKVLVPPAARLAGVAMVRVTAIFEGMSRLSVLVGASLAGILIAWVSAPRALVVTAASFIISALLVTISARPPQQPEPGGAAPKTERYRQAMLAAIAHLRHDRITFDVVAMLFVINVFNQASGVVFIPLWADRVTGSSVSVGEILGASALGLVLGNLAFTVFATKVPRYAAFTLGFLLGGPPRFLVLGLSHSLIVVLVVTFLAGCALSSVNPIVGLLMFQHTPAELQARVFGLATAVAWAGLPLGSLLGGLVVSGTGLRPALLITSACYLAVALIPVVGYRTWRRIGLPVSQGAADQ
jgi:MFS family permease